MLCEGLIQGFQGLHVWLSSCIRTCSFRAPAAIHASGVLTLFPHCPSFYQLLLHVVSTTHFNWFCQDDGAWAWQLLPSGLLWMPACSSWSSYLLLPGSTNPKDFFPKLINWWQVHQVAPTICWYWFILLSFRAGKMNWILHCDWLLSRQYGITCCVR